MAIIDETSNFSSLVLPIIPTPEVLNASKFNLSFDITLQSIFQQINVHSEYAVVPVDDSFLKRISSDIKGTNIEEKVLSLVELAGLMGRFDEFENAYYLYFKAFEIAGTILNVCADTKKDLVYGSLIGIGKLLLRKFTRFSTVADIKSIFEYLNDLIPGNEAHDYVHM
jgi:hypothetical protein